MRRDTSTNASRLLLRTEGLFRLIAAAGYIRDRQNHVSSAVIWLRKIASRTLRSRLTLQPRPSLTLVRTERPQGAT